jgi:hypothetical protein
VADWCDQMANETNVSGVGRSGAVALDVEEELG